MGSFPDLFLSECPEEAYDPRSLYERLQEQREKKQQEFEEQFKFSKHQKLLFWIETQQTACIVCNSCIQHLAKGHICVSCLPLWETNWGFRKVLGKSCIFQRWWMLLQVTRSCGTRTALHTYRTQKLLAVMKLHSCKVWNTRLILHVKLKKKPKQKQSNPGTNLWKSGNLTWFYDS